jgi:hypothetical protein
MHSCSTQSELHSRVEHGAPMSRVNSTQIFHKVGDGHSMKKVSPGFLYGAYYLFPLRPAVDWLNVTARLKADNVGAHAKSLIGSALNFADVTVIPKTSII